MSDFDIIGGQRRIDAITDDFYKRVLSDDRVRHYFAGINMQELKEKLAKTQAMLLGGPEYTYRIRGEVVPMGEALQAAHARLGVTDEHYDIVCTHYMMAVHTAGVPFHIAAKLGQKLVEVEPLIVSKRVTISKAKRQRKGTVTGWGTFI